MKVIDYQRAATRLFLLLALFYLGGVNAVAQQGADRIRPTDPESGPSPFTQADLRVLDATSTQPSQGGNIAAKQKRVPLAAKQKFRFGLKQAFITPGAYIGPAVGAFFLERYEVKRPGKTAGDKFADGASRFARGFATRSTSELL